MIIMLNFTRTRNSLICGVPLFRNPYLRGRAEIPVFAQRRRVAINQQKKKSGLKIMISNPVEIFSYILLCFTPTARKGAGNQQGDHNIQYKKSLFRVPARQP